MCFPTGERRQPFGRSVPFGEVPGHSAAWLSFRHARTRLTPTKLRQNRFTLLFGRAPNGTTSNDPVSR